MYVFRPDDPAEINDWVSDGHMFSCEGTRKIKGRIGAMTKKYFYLLIKTERKKQITDKRFRKEIFTCSQGGGQVVRWCWVNFQKKCRGVLQF